MPDKHGDKVRIQHMLDAINKIKTYVGSSGKEEFEIDTKLQDACIRQLQIIGEAAKHVSKNLQSNQNDIPWPKIIGLRNVVIHDYAGVDPDIIWNIISDDLPDLLIKLDSIEKDLPDEVA